MKAGDKVWFVWDSGETEAWTKATILAIVNGYATLDIEHGKEHKLGKAHLSELAAA